MTDASFPGSSEPFDPGQAQTPLDMSAGAGFAMPEAHRCDDTPMLVLRALEGMPDPAVIEATRNLLGVCPPCVGMLDVEMRFKVAMAQQTTYKAPASLQLRISETLQRVDLGDIDVTDL